MVLSWGRKNFHMNFTPAAAVTASYLFACSCPTQSRWWHWVQLVQWHFWGAFRPCGSNLYFVQLIVLFIRFSTRDKTLKQLSFFCFFLPIKHGHHIFIISFHHIFPFKTKKVVEKLKERESCIDIKIGKIKRLRLTIH